MTDPTPEERIHELEQHRARLVAAHASSAGDSAALLIVRPGARELISALAAEDLAAVTLEVLRWMDELLLNPENDELRFDIEVRAQVALDTTPDGLADLE